MKHFFFYVFIFATLVCWSQTNNPPTITADGNQAYCPLSQINVATNFNIIDTDDTTIDEFHVQISTGYAVGEDILMLTGTHPNIVTSWSVTEGKLSLGGVANQAVLLTDMIAAVNDVVFESTNPNLQTDKTFSFTIGDANYLPSTDHFYEYVPYLSIDWQSARDLAATYTYYGLQGYLATITTQEEAVLTGEQAAGAGWIGGSDEETEGVWKWMTGPEAGTVFWTGGVNGSTPNYANWNTGEPNSFGNEDYAHVTAPGEGIDGSWNDLPLFGDPDPDVTNPYHPKGFMVEYGGTPGDPVLNISASTSIYVPEVIDVIHNERCGIGSLVLEATASSGTILWFDAITGGNQVGSGLTFTTPVLSNNATYYALASENGCTEGPRAPVNAVIKPIPTIDSFTDETICESATATISATSAGNINWYDAAVGGNLLATGSSFTTPLLSATTTYYAEPEYDGCVGTRQAVTVTIQITNAPTGNALQTFCDIDNATLSDLAITGTNISWYDASNGGNVLNDIDLLTTGFYYASQTENGCESVNRAQIEVVIYETVSLPTTIPSLEACDTDADGNASNGFTEFDLTLNETSLLNGSDATDFTIEYYSDSSYVTLINTPETFINTVANTQTVYARIRNINAASCYVDASFEITVKEKPIIEDVYTLQNCDEDGVSDGFTDFNLSDLDATIIGSTNYTLSYHLTETDAHNNVDALNPFPFNNATANEVYVRVENDDCYAVAMVSLLVSTTSIPDDFMQELVACDDNGISTFNLDAVSQDFIDLFPSNQSLQVYYYETLDDALLEQNEITNTSNYENIIPFSQVLYVRVGSEDNNECFGVGPHLTLTVNQFPEFEIDQSDVFCLDDEPIELSIYNPQGNYTYEWTNNLGDIVGSQQSIEVNDAGQYTVIATSVEGCQSLPETFNVVASGVASITPNDITIVEFSNNNSITIDTNNLGLGDYEFALNDEFGWYQDSPYFGNVPSGEHTIFVRDKNGCGTTSITVFVSGFPKFFTPNGDTYNDTWNLRGWSTDYSNASNIKIFDRYGKLIKQIGPLSYGWDGTFNGVALPSTDFWYIATLVKIDGTTTNYSGHFSLVR